MKNLYQKKREQGFTIIEVMIVLAIAGLIMLIVFIAIPQLQRNQRNTARQNIVGRIKTEIDNYSANNRGKIPVNQTELSEIKTRYFTGINIDDPKTGTPMLTDSSYNAGAPTSGVYTGTEGVVSYRDQRTCDGEKAASGTSRQYALWTILEGGSIYCVDNK